VKKRGALGTQIHGAYKALPLGSRLLARMAAKLPPETKVKIIKKPDGRTARARLTDEQVREMRNLSAVHSMKTLSQMFGVPYEYVRTIIIGETRRHVI